jgi:flagellar motility protein MotE (MotC chaperone)
MSKGYNDFFKLKKKNSSSGTHIRTSNQNKSHNQDKWDNEIMKNFLNVKSKSHKKSKVKPTPWSILVFGLLFTGVGAFGYLAPNEFDQFLNRIKVGVGVPALAKDEENKTATKDADKAENAAGTKAETKDECDSKSSYAPEEVSHFSRLGERKKELDLRETELNALEEELHKQKSEIEARLEKLTTVRDDVAKVLKERVEVDQMRVDKLVEFYSNMKPKQAADIFSKLNEDLAVEVLGKMKKKNAADIMNLLEPAKARALSEKFAGYMRR